MINPGTKHYALSHLPDRKDAKGFYYPDAVIEPYVNAYKKDLPSSPASPEIQPRFTLDEAKQLIIGAFRDFSPALAEKAEAMFTTATYNPRPQGDYFAPDYKLDIEDGSRWNIHAVEPGKARLMRSLAALSDQNELGPANPNPHAVIEFEFDGTMNSVVYMAHEMGHAMADDNIAKPADYKHGDHKTPKHVQETQAYVPQLILYDYLERHSDKGISDSARHHRLSTLKENIDVLLAADKAISNNRPDRDKLIERMHERPMSFLTAATIYNRVKDQPVDRRDMALDFLHEKYGPKTIAHALAAVGIERPGQLTASLSPAGRQDGYGIAVPGLSRS